MKKIIPLLLTSLLLCSCDFAKDRSNEIFEQEKIIGDEYFKEISAVPDKEKKTVTIQYKDFTSAPCKISNYNGKDYNYKYEYTSEGWFGIKTHTYYYWYMFLVSLNDEDNQYMCQTFREIIEEKTSFQVEEASKGNALSSEVSILLSNTIPGAAIGIQKKKVDSKFDDSYNRLHIYAVLGNTSDFYNGNSSFKFPSSDSSQG